MRPFSFVKKVRSEENPEEFGGSFICLAIGDNSHISRSLLQPSKSLLLDEM